MTAAPTFLKHSRPRRRSRLLTVFVLAALLSTPLPGERLAITIDTSATGEPIHPFVYGQFIEHLGRCIYGGIWAEMLEDRKFYYPVTADYQPYGENDSSDYPVVRSSPWQIIGPAEGVSMVREHSFVGDHTPLLHEGNGIRQKDLAVVKGKAYTGYLWARSPQGRLEVALVTGRQRQSQSFTLSGESYARHAFTFEAPIDSEDAYLEIQVREGEAYIGTASLMPADNIRGMRADTLDLLKALNAPIYRWPGGNFVSGYEWRDGIGDRDRRPPRKNPAWTGVEHNDFGTDEFIDFCREINTEPAIAVNTGFGDPHSAAEWVEYCNRSADTVGGRRRIDNGHAQAFDVNYWCVGNEMFGTWQLGYMQLHHYTEKHNRTARAMWEVDDSLTLIGVGAIGGINEDHDPTAAQANRGWSRGMLESSADFMTWISEHFYDGRVPWSETGKLDTIEHVGLMKKNIRRIVDQHRALQASLPNLNGRTIPIAMDEWNYWHRDYVYGELGCIYDLGDGLGIAAGLHEYFRQSDLIIMANYAQTVNVIGCIKTSKTAAEFATTGLVLKLYRERFGQIPIRLAWENEVYDLSAALTEDGRSLTVGVVNPTDEALHLELELTEAGMRGNGTQSVITGERRESHNRPGRPREVDIQTLDEIDGTRPLSIPALSNSLFVFPLH